MAGPSFSVWLSRAGVFAFRVMQDIIQTLPSTPMRQLACSMPKWPNLFSIELSRQHAMSCAMYSQWGTVRCTSASWTAHRSLTKPTRSHSPCVQYAYERWVTILTLKVRSYLDIRNYAKLSRLWTIKIRTSVTSASLFFSQTSSLLLRNVPVKRQFQYHDRVWAINKPIMRAAPKNWWREWTGKCLPYNRHTMMLSSSVMAFHQSS